jgi:hypothetical protein
MTQLRGAGTRDLVLGVLALVLLAAAAFFFIRSRSKGDAPTTEFVEFFCPKCNHHFKLSYRDFEEKIWNKHQYKVVEGERNILFKCPNCGQITAERVDEPDAQPPPPAGEPGT